MRVYHFYADNPHQILPLLLYKLNTSLAYSGFLKIFLLLTFFIFTVDLFRLKHKIIIPAFILVSTAALLVLAGPVYQCALLLLLYIPASACQARASGAAQRIPLSFDYIFFSLLIFSVIAMGNQRYFEVLNLFFVFFAFVALVKTVVAFVERKDF
ncbi:MAG: hypothetical protein BWY70_00589 [Bacteroidetes bacterium ADurb.Bin408]|nr:MAG: hypothetical protein BWY70_00589 [Bacteroidetes bacterium ADurb.Bin408]